MGGYRECCEIVEDANDARTIGGPSVQGVELRQVVHMQNLLTECLLELIVTLAAAVAVDIRQGVAKYDGLAWIQVVNQRPGFGSVLTPKVHLCRPAKQPIAPLDKCRDRLNRVLSIRQPGTRQEGSLSDSVVAGEEILANERIGK